VRALREEPFPFDRERDEASDGGEGVAFRARAAHDEHSVRAAAHGERQIDVPSAIGGGHLGGLPGAADAFEKRVGGVESLPDRDDDLGGAVAEEHQSATRGPDRPQGAARRFAQRADAVRGGEKVDREVVERLHLRPARLGVRRPALGAGDETAHDDRGEEERREGHPIRGVRDRPLPDRRQEEVVVAGRRGERRGRGGRESEPRRCEKDDDEVDEADGRRVRADRPAEGRCARDSEERERDLGGAFSRGCCVRGRPPLPRAGLRTAWGARGSCGSSLRSSPRAAEARRPRR